MFQGVRPQCLSCFRCLRASGSHGLQSSRRHNFATTPTAPIAASLVLSWAESTPKPKRDDDEGHSEETRAKEGAVEERAMSRRLSEMTEHNLEEGGRSARKAVEEAGFDDELKQRLLNRIADSNFKNEHPSAFSQVNIPSSAGPVARETAAARPWSGTESLEDAALRMLNDSRKPLRRPAKVHAPARAPKKVDTGRAKQSASTGTRLANARDRSSVYSYLRDESLSEKERDQFRKQLKDKFTSGARPLPQSFQGLASLANERIEDAIARGQFKNLPRGKKIERDYQASSPFLDTTEYFMNKIIQRQEIVPPWIEKQQELLATASKFRSRLRADWRRHAARTISSRGGSLESQILRAEQFAAAEALVNPSPKKQEKLNAMDSEGHLSQITVTGKTERPEHGGDEPAIKISVTEDSVQENDDRKAADDPAQPSAVSPPGSPEAEKGMSDVDAVGGTVFTFRDPKWEEIERAYHKAAIENLNSMTRSYNLMAPNLAKKPYFSLERELRICFADVAPQIAGEIRDRANAPKVKIEVTGHTPGGVLDKFGGGTAHVYDERRPQYGFKEFWRDLFGSKNTQ